MFYPQIFKSSKILRRATQGEEFMMSARPYLAVPISGTPFSFERRRSVIRFTLFLGTLLMLNSAAGAATLCTKGESSAFTCQTKNKKIISVCIGAENIVEYRYGKPGASEISVEAVAFGNNMYSGGALSYARAPNGAVEYIVYTGSGKGWISAGVAVEKQGRQISVVPCATHAEDRDFYDLKEMLLPDTIGFELPDPQ